MCTARVMLCQQWAISFAQKLTALQQQQQLDMASMTIQPSKMVSGPWNVQRPDLY